MTPREWLILIWLVALSLAVVRIFVLLHYNMKIHQHQVTLTSEFGKALADHMERTGDDA